MSKAEMNDAPLLTFRDAAAFETWLESNSDRRAGVWLKLAKAGTGVPSLTSDESGRAILGA